MTEDKPQYHMVFDVESIGLHGEGFAVGWVVIDDGGKRIDQGLIHCAGEWARGSWFNHDWVRANVTVETPNDIAAYPIYPDPRSVRAGFWEQWERWKEQGAQLWADCAWPVEARFLTACIEDDYARREWAGPYPLHDIATLALAKGHDPVKTWDREPDELPAHNPLMDARQGARLLVKFLNLQDG